MKKKWTHVLSSCCAPDDAHPLDARRRSGLAEHQRFPQTTPSPLPASDHTETIRNNPLIAAIAVSRPTGKRGGHKGNFRYYPFDKSREQLDGKENASIDENISLKILTSGATLKIISMDRHEFKANATGRLVPVLTPNAPPDVQLAFVPNPLPPKWEWPNRLWPLLVEARTRLASLDGTGKHLPNPDILLKPLEIREAQLSSQLEGTITDPQQQALFEADPRYPVSVADPNNAHREVFNYGRALRLRLDGKMELPLSLRLVRELHLVLMDGVRGSDQRPGEFRVIQNQIGRPARFVPPPPQELPGVLDAFEKYLHMEDGFDPLVKAFLAHYQFEAIHPFADGNGRVGRLLLALTIAEWCGLSNQWLYMSAYFEKNKRDYMDLLLGVSTHGAWDLWIQFCLEGVVSQAQDTERRCDRLLKLHRDFHERIKDGSYRLAALVDGLFKSPVIMASRAKRSYGISYPTARADLAKLETIGIVKRLENMKQITYYCPQIYDITFEDVN
jgi:Fic family protein